jgi:hypothetical protein
MEYDKNNNTSFWRQYMRVRVKVDVRQPLKKGQRVRDKEGAWCMVNFKYEKLGVFCFVCGIMGHAENKCEVRFAMENDDGRREWSGELRADNRRGGGRQTSRWLREEREGGNEVTSGDEGGRRRRTATEIPSMEPISADVSTGTSELPLHQHHADVIINGPLIPLNGHVHRNTAALTNFLENEKTNLPTHHNVISTRQASRQQLLSIQSGPSQQSLVIPPPSNPVTDLPPLYW